MFTRSSRAVDDDLRSKVAVIYMQAADYFEIVSSPSSLVAEKASRSTPTSTPSRYRLRRHLFSIIIIPECHWLPILLFRSIVSRLVKASLVFCLWSASSPSSDPKFPHSSFPIHDASTTPKDPASRVTDKVGHLKGLFGGAPQLSIPLTCHPRAPIEVGISWLSPSLP